jgi:hypothetical protein
LAKLIAHDDKATHGLGVFSDVLKGTDVKANASKFLDLFPESPEAVAILRALDHVRDAAGKEPFLLEMLADADKAKSATLTLEYATHKVAEGASGLEFEIPLGGKRLDFRPPTAENVEVKFLTWESYSPFTIEKQFLSMKVQSEPFIADAAARGVGFYYLFDTAMPEDFRKIFDTVFGNSAASVGFRYPDWR